MSPKKNTTKLPVVFDIVDERVHQYPELSSGYKKIAQIRQEYFEHRLVWANKYKNYLKKEIKADKDYKKLIEKQEEQENVGVELAPMFKAIEKRREKLQEEKQKLEEMRAEDDLFDIKELIAMRRLLKEQTQDIDLSTIVDFSNRR
jgi:hypothetical protein